MRIEPAIEATLVAEPWKGEAHISNNREGLTQLQFRISPHTRVKAHGRLSVYTHANSWQSIQGFKLPKLSKAYDNAATKP